MSMRRRKRTLGHWAGQFTGIAYQYRKRNRTSDK
jgi:hypothetical protein